VRRISDESPAARSAKARARAVIRMDLCYPAPPMSHGTFWYGYYFN